VGILAFFITSTKDMNSIVNIEIILIAVLILAVILKITKALKK
jgi:hypothetical protein